MILRELVYPNMPYLYLYFGKEFIHWKYSGFLNFRNLCFLSLYYYPYFGHVVVIIIAVATHLSKSFLPIGCNSSLKLDGSRIPLQLHSFSAQSINIHGVAAHFYLFFSFFCSKVFGWNMRESGQLLHGGKPLHPGFAWIHKVVLLNIRCHLWYFCLC